MSCLLERLDGVHEVKILGTKLKSKPPKNTQCDMTVDYDYSGNQPQLIRCTNIATIGVQSFPAEAWICQSCYDVRYGKE